MIFFFSPRALLLSEFHSDGITLHWPKGPTLWTNVKEHSSRSNRTWLKCRPLQTSAVFTIMLSGQRSLPSCEWQTRHFDKGRTSRICFTSRIIQCYCHNSLIFFLLRGMRVSSIQTLDLLSHSGQTQWTTQRLSSKPPAAEPLRYLRHGVRLASPAWETHSGLVRVWSNCKSTELPQLTPVVSLPCTVLLAPLHHFWSFIESNPWYLSPSI